MGFSKDTASSAGQPSCSTLMGVIVVPVGSGGFGSVGQEGRLKLGVGYCGGAGRGGGEHREWCTGRQENDTTRPIAQGNSVLQWLLVHWGTPSGLSPACAK